MQEPATPPAQARAPSNITVAIGRSDAGASPTPLQSSSDDESTGGGWSLRAAIAPVFEIASALAAAAAAAWRRWYLRIPLLIGGWVVAFGVALGLALAPLLDRFAAPAAVARASELLQREVRARTDGTCKSRGRRLIGPFAW
jgi:hypothetical protein